MTARYFIDTNVLVYAASCAIADQIHRDLALTLLDRQDLALSAQVLAEFYALATSKTKLNLSHDDAVRLMEALDRIPTCSISRSLVMSAVKLRSRFQISYWDAAIIAAAQEMGCDAVLSEDLNADQDYGGVVVINPFAASLP